MPGAWATPSRGSGGQPRLIREAPGDGLAVQLRLQELEARHGEDSSRLLEGHERLWAQARIEVVEGRLVIRDTAFEFAVHVLDLETGTHLRSFGRAGQGPGEFIGAWSIDAAGGFPGTTGEPSAPRQGVPTPVLQHAYQSRLAANPSRTRRGFPGRANLGQYVPVYNWDGMLLDIYRIEDDTVGLAVDPDGKYLYTLRHEPAPAVVRHVLGPAPTKGARVAWPAGRIAK